MKHLLLFSLSFCLLQSCYYDKEDKLYPTSNGIGCDTSVTTYSSTVQPIVVSKCASSGCHVAGAQSPDLSTYAKLNANIARVQVRALQDKTMPPSGPLSVCDITKFTSWIRKGAQNN